MSHSLGGPRPCLRRILQVGVKQPAFTVFQIGVEVKRIALIVRRPSHRDVDDPVASPLTFTSRL